MKIPVQKTFRISLHVKIEKRLVISKWVLILVPTLSTLLGIILGALIFPIMGVSPFKVYSIIIRVITDPRSFTNAIELSIPIMFTSLALALPFRMAFYNIGGEGQFELGAIGAMIPIILYWSGLDLPSPIFIPSMFILAFLLGGIWGFIPAVLKAKWKVNEILVSLMLNIVSLQIIWYLVSPGGPWNEANPCFKKRYLAYLKELGVHIIPGFKGTPVVPEFVRVPKIPGVNVNVCILIAIIAAIILYMVLTRTILGYEVKVVGESELAAQYAGINYFKLATVTMFISGGLAGLGGFSVISSYMPKLSPEIASPGYGYTGIIVVWLSRLNPLACVLVSILFGILTRSAYIMQQELKISHYVSLSFEGLIFILLVIGEFFINYRIKVLKR